MGEGVRAAGCRIVPRQSPCDGARNTARLRRATIRPCNPPHGGTSLFDILIKNGRVIDGSGSPAFEADVAIAGDRIAAIGKIEGQAKRTVDAKGLAVTPGFIDLHTHSDFQFFVDPSADSKTTQGVTTEFMGNCGLSMCAPLHGPSREDMDTRVDWYDTKWRANWTGFPAYMEALEKTGKALNVITQVGHGTVRKAILGMETRAPDEDELKQMQSLVAEALDAGALGLSTGLSMPPAVYSTTLEVITLAREAAKRGLLYSSHIRDSGDEGAGLFVSVEEALEIGRRTGVKVQVSHLKCNGATRGKADKVLGRIEEARHEGIDAAADQYPYIAASGAMSMNIFPRWAMAGGRQKALERVKDADLRAAIREHLDERTASIGGAEKLMIASYPIERQYEGKTVVQVAKDMRCGPSEALLRLFEKFDPQLILSGMAEADVDKIAAHPLVAVGSDGNSLKATGPLSTGNPHPRSYGTFPRFFAQMVREKKLMSFEEAVRKSTSLPAERIGLTKRGRLAPGYFADVAVINPETIVDRATFTAPHQYSVGVEHVLVNGALAVSNGKPTSETAGRVIKTMQG
ncbi:MAG: D-aminoacylase [Dehalococcoidia bacterium]|nr:D-aminoacylase [Dehalococcoidia bacterium]